jgi:DNA repair protein RadC
MDVSADKTVPISQWAEDDRPREKLAYKGRTALSDAELLGILLGSGTRACSAVELAKRVLATSANNLNELGKLTLGDLVKIRGIGPAKAVSIIAAMELGRRRRDQAVHEKKLVRTSRDAYDYLLPYVADNNHEQFWVLLLNRSNKIIHVRMVSTGGLHSTVVDTRMIFRIAMEHLASAIVLCHNHPSGNVSPSNSDVQLTTRLRDAGKILEVPVVDHIIIGDRQYYSFADEGLI